MLSSLYSQFTGDGGAVAASGEANEGAHSSSPPPVAEVAAGGGAAEVRVEGENGHMAILTGTCGDALVALDTECQRDTPISSLRDLLGAVWDDARETEDGLDTFGRFLGQLRDPRNGKGERATFRNLVIHWVHEKVPVAKMEPVFSILCSFIGEYGYQKDLVIMWETLTSTESGGEQQNVMASCIQDFMVRQLREDMRSETPSLLAKWMPRWRKNRRTNALIDAVAADIWSNAISARTGGEITDKTRAYLRMQYRKAMSALSERLNVVERKMCANEWDAIVPKEVPSVATNKYRKAFLNLNTAGNERTDDPRRKACAERFQGATKSGAVNANVVDIARLVQQMLMKSTTNDDEIALLNAQWRKLEEDIGDEIVGMVPMIDVSGSMQGTPMYAAIGIGLMLARKNRGPLNGMQFTFEETPTMCWVEGGVDGDPYEQVRDVVRAGWGGSTNFQAALTMLFEHLDRHGLREEMSSKVSLVILSDMQVNQAHQGEKSQKTLFEGIVSDFQSREWGSVPPIVFWNLRATGTAPVRADEIGVISMSGQSTKLAKAFLNGESITKMLSKTPAEKLREVLSVTEQDTAGNMGRQIWRILNTE